MFGIVIDRDSKVTCKLVFNFNASSGLRYSLLYNLCNITRGGVENEAVDFELNDAHLVAKLISCHPERCCWSKN